MDRDVISHDEFSAWLERFSAEQAAKLRAQGITPPEVAGMKPPGPKYADPVIHDRAPAEAARDARDVPMASRFARQAPEQDGQPPPAWTVAPTPAAPSPLFAAPERGPALSADDRAAEESARVAGLTPDQLAEEEDRARRKRLRAQGMDAFMRARGLAK